MDARYFANTMLELSNRYKTVRIINIFTEHKYDIGCTTHFCFELWLNTIVCKTIRFDSKTGEVVGELPDGNEDWNK